MTQKAPNPPCTSQRPTAAAAPPLGTWHTGVASAGLISPGGWEVIDSAELARLRRIEAAARALREGARRCAPVREEGIELDRELGLPT